jgi:hypothetical protein
MSGESVRGGDLAVFRGFCRFPARPTVGLARFAEGNRSKMGDNAVPRIRKYVRRIGSRRNGGGTLAPQREYVRLIGNARDFGKLGDLAARFEGITPIASPRLRPLAASWRDFQRQHGRFGRSASRDASSGLWRESWERRLEKPGSGVLHTQANPPTPC